MAVVDSVIAVKTLTWSIVLTGWLAGVSLACRFSMRRLNFTSNLTFPLTLCETPIT